VDAQLVAVAGGALERGHRRGEATGNQLGVEHGPVPQDREPLGESAENSGERAMPLPVADLTAPVPCLHPVSCGDRRQRTDRYQWRDSTGTPVARLRTG
jgi:hypothetical protein